MKLKLISFFMAMAIFSTPISAQSPIVNKSSYKYQSTLDASQNTRGFQSVLDLDSRTISLTPFRTTEIFPSAEYGIRSRDGWYYDYDEGIFRQLPTPTANSEVSCTRDNFEVFTQLAQALDFKQCFDIRPAEDLSDEQELGIDNNVCKCLNEFAKKNKPLEKTLTLSTADMKNISADKKESYARKETARKWKDLRSRSIRLAFDATIKVNPDFGVAYKNNLATSVLENIKNMKGNSKFITEAKKIMEQATKSGVRFVHDNNLLKTIIEESEKQKDDKLNENLLDDARTNPMQCVSGREFLAFKQFPQQNTIYKELQKNFKPEEWDIDLLKRQYQMHMRTSMGTREKNKDQIIAIKEKIKFLNKNPLLSTFFSMPTDPNQYEAYFLLNNVSDEDKKIYRDLLAKGHIEQKRKELFGIIQNFAKGESCEKSPTECLTSAIKKKDNLKNYNDKLATFFSNSRDVANLARLADGNNFTEKFQDLFDLRTEEQTTEGDQVVVPTRSEILSEVKETSGLDPAVCGKDQNKTDPMVCAQAYALYCPKVQVTITSQGVQTVDPLLRNDLEEQLKDDFNPDYESNNALKEFNKTLCEDRHKKGPHDEGMTFFEYRDEFCSGSKKVPFEKCRNNFIKEYKLEGEFEAFGEFAASEQRPQSVKEETKRKLIKPSVASTNGSSSGLLSDNDFRRIGHEAGLPSFQSRPSDTQTAQASVLSAPSTASSSEQTSQESSPSYASSPVMNYPMAASTYVAPETKIENLSDEKKQQMLSDWKQDLDDLKKKNSEGGQMSPIVASQEAAMKAKIDALEQALADQRKLTEEQRDLLNKAIAAQSQRPSGQSANENEIVQAPKSRAQSSVVTAADVTRAPASVDASKVASVVVPQTVAAPLARIGGKSTLSSSVSDASAVAREEAKLVNLRNGSNGSLTVEAVSNSSQSKANAIAITVSDDQYKLLQANPESLNLSQLEKSIPKEQIDRLEKNGQIILLLQNGSNPPFEVKVQRKDKRLVLSRLDKNGKPQEPVRRVHTLSGLGTEIKQAVK